MIRQSFKNICQKCNIRHRSSSRYPTVTPHDSDEDDISLDEEIKFTEILQDIQTAQKDLLKQITDMTIVISKIQKKIDYYHKQTDILQTRINANESKQAIFTNSILSMKENISTLKKKMAELENLNSYSNIHCLEIPEEETGMKIIELFQKFVQLEAQKNTSISTDSNMSTANSTEVPIPESTCSLEENPISPTGKTPKRSNPENTSRNSQKARSNIYMYPDFRTWIKLMFVQGGKWRVFLHASNLDEFVQWLLCRPTEHPEEALITPHRESLFGGFIENLTKLYLSVVNYFYCRFGFSEVEVTRL
ncbi:coiled-coil domain-containing protein 54-like [Perognathus longimembris pacificus]|uniref:coiled-coil domain-containing protein 54-like n=1 Tax=Perognathus longimembris pacificus TaxID=214514 RepID=UPI0020190AA2|nr:coiled-coil domain-containing protein 54-like [Perognathus longimembris pacificus]